MREENPVLLACVHRDHGLKKQLAILEDISGENKELKICLLYEDFSEIHKLLKIDGTPTFVMFSDNKERGRLLGKADKNMLSAFIMRSLEKINGSRPDKEHREQNTLQPAGTHQSQ
jgi:hypothetical protein